MRYVRPALPLLACLLAAAVGSRASGAENGRLVELNSPLTTVVPLPDFSPRPITAVTCTLVVPDDAPADLGVGAYVNDPAGNWYQALRSGPLGPGIHALRFDLDAGARINGTPHRGGWPGQAGLPVQEAGIFLWSAAATPCRILVRDLRCDASPPGPSATGTEPRLCDLGLQEPAPDLSHCRAHTGRAWTCSVLPDPLPSGHHLFALALEVTDPEGVVRTVHGCHLRPTRRVQREDRESDVPAGRGRYRVRYYPRLPGRHRLVARATWSDHPDGGPSRVLRSPLPDLIVEGGPWQPGQPVDLDAPLVTVVPAFGFRPRPVRAIDASVLVPGNAPADLGVGAFAADHDGNWFQVTKRRRLTPGLHRLHFELEPDAAVAGIEHRGDWPSHAGIRTWRTGLFFWSADTRRCRMWAKIRPSPLFDEPRSAADVDPPDAPALLDLRLQDLDPQAGVCRVDTGERWELRVRPTPFPSNPCEPAEFELRARITDPAGVTRVVRGFFAQPYRLADGGDRETVRIDGPGTFRLRFRPRLPGRHRVELVGHWGQGDAAYSQPRSKGRWRDRGRRLRVRLPDLVASGPHWDDYVRVDATDPRFFAVGSGEESRFYWPLGLNIRSVNDPRGRRCVGSRITPDRGSLAYAAYLRRLAAAGGNAVEIWMSSWNLALEWRADWRGYHGIGRFNLANAERLDRILDLAEELGIRVNLVIDNHGKASDHVDHEWENNPYNRRLGGPCEAAHEWFTHPEARRGQERLRRYVVARYADQPAVLAWKLLTEINLTAGRPTDQRRWTCEAGDRWRELDPYGHPVTIHWSNDYRKPDRSICVQDQIDFLCIDAYYWPRDQASTYLVDLLWNSTNDPRLGLSHPEVWARRAAALKPVLVTEYGGSWFAGPRERLLAEHQSGPWIAAVSGHGGAPMLWWFEWVDQENLWRPFAALTRFLAGEDLRSRPGSPASTSILPVRPPHRLWVGAWTRRGRILGYVMDRTWQFDGRSNRPHRGVEITISARPVDPGPMTIEWWDAHNGTVISRRGFRHTGGPLRVAAPTFRHHVAFKLWRGAPEADASREGVR